MRACLVALVLLAGCATTQSPVRESWLRGQYYWQHAAKEGALLKRKDGGSMYLPPATISAILTAKSRIEAVSGIQAELALVETETPNAFALVHEGRNLIAISISYLDHLGQDTDALASTIGHELAHLRLGHSADERKQRAQSARAGGNMVGAVLSVAGVPFANTIAGLGATAYANSYTRDEERAADDLGLRWAVQAGFDPCGEARVMEMFSKLGHVSVPFLSTHPGHGERSELANSYSLKVNGKSC